MAASSGWRTRLAALFAESRRDKMPIESHTIDVNTTKNVMDIKDGHIFLWDHTQQCVLSINLVHFEKQQHSQQQQHHQRQQQQRRRPPPNNTDDDTENDADDASFTAAQFQNLIPTCRPVYEIQALVSNPTTQRLALVGLNGVNVVELPRRPSTNKERNDAAGRTLCSSVEIAERYFLCNPNCRVIRVKWHPASDTSTHLVILFSNNYLRVYDSRFPTTPTHVYQLGPIPVFRLSSKSINSFGSALGETAVDFDFGRPEQAIDKFDRRLVDRMMDDRAVIWPMFILRGNGDVYSMWITDPRFSLKCEVKGPLTMHPPAEDNYGADACSILCVPCTPPVLAIATCSGILYHCVVLDAGPEDIDGDNHLALETLSSSWSAAKSSQTLAAPDFTLYVYESVELELVLANNSSVSESSQDDIICPILLHKDPTTICRYHCSHVAGVHTVALPIVAQLEQLVTEISGNIEDILSTIESQTCIIEHLICTKPLPDSSPSPVLGLGVTYGHLLGDTTLLCLVAPFDLLSQPLVPTYLEHSTSLLTEDQDYQASNSSLSSKEPFDQHIRKILQRRTSNPVFKTNLTENPNPQECLQLLNRSTRILREEYIEKLDLAREKIHQRIKVLEDLRAQQVAELKVLNRYKDELTSRAEALAERYEDLREKHLAISKRMEMVLRALLRETPELSDAELEMQRQLKNLEEKLKHLKNSIEKVRAKQAHQEQRLAKEDSSFKSGLHARPTEAQIKLIKEMLKNQSQALESLTQETNKIHKMLGM